MPNVNVVLLAGFLTRDPEVIHTNSGLVVAKLGLAVNKKWKDQQGNKKESVCFVDIDLFGKTAEIAGQYLSKGKPVMIEGELRLDQWDDKQTGQKRSKLKVAGHRLHFLGTGGEKGQQPDGAPRQGSNQQPAPARATATVPPDELEDDDSSIPF
jgi:single-strand DNA-binding protein